MSDSETMSETAECYSDMVISESETESELETDNSDADNNDSDIEIDVVRQKVVTHCIRSQRFVNYTAFGFMCVVQNYFNIGMFDADKKKYVTSVFLIRLNHL